MAVQLVSGPNMRAKIFLIKAGSSTLAMTRSLPPRADRHNTGSGPGRQSLAGEPHQKGRDAALYDSQHFA
jgi:hypothetical protein